MGYLDAALALGFVLAFAGWVLWLRERRKVTLVARIDAFERTLDIVSVAVERHSEALKVVVATVENLALKAGFKAKP
jgi:hypothetical protein